MAKKPFVIAVILCLLAGLLVGAVLAQTSPNFDLSWHAFGSGGNSRSSANYTIQDITGLAPVGSSQSANSAIIAGFYAPDMLVIFLPMIQK